MTDETRPGPPAGDDAADDASALPVRGDGDTPAGPDLAEEGRALASERDDLIAAGADPSDLLVPLHPDDAGTPPPAPDDLGPSLDPGDTDPDSLVGEPVDTDIDLSHLTVDEDQDGGDAS